MVMARRLLWNGNWIRTKRRLTSNGRRGYGIVAVDTPHPEAPVHFVAEDTGVTAVALRSEVVLPPESGSRIRAKPTASTLNPISPLSTRPVTQSPPIRPFP